MLSAVRRGWLGRTTVWREPRVLVIAFAVLFLLAMSGPTWAGPPRTLVVGSIPRAVLANSTVRVPGRVRGPGDRVVLQRRLRAGWTAIGQTAPSRSTRAFTLNWHTPVRAGFVRVRAVALVGRRVVAKTRTSRVRVTSGRFSATRKGVVLKGVRVASLPEPGEPGIIVFNTPNAVRARTSTTHGVGQPVVVNDPVDIVPGQVFVRGYSTDTPNGVIGKALAITTSGSQTLVQFNPATLLDAGAHGAVSALKETEPPKFEPSVADRNIRCSDGASALIGGNVRLSLKPVLQASISLLPPRLDSADFALTAAASATLHAKTQATTGCKFTVTVPTKAARIGAFEGEIGGFPIVVVLEGQLTLGAAFHESGEVSVAVSPSVGATGGISYRRKGGFHAILPHPVTSFPFSVPSFQASGRAEASIEPNIQLLVYGVAGPELKLSAGLDLTADTAVNPWWTLTAPVEISAGLAAPVLGLRQAYGPVRLWGTTFPVADARGPFGGPAGPTVPDGTNPDSGSLSGLPTPQTTALVSKALQGDAASADASYLNGVSADGRYVTFVSAGAGTPPSDTAAPNQLFERDLHTGATRLVSTSLSGSTGANSNVLFGNSRAAVSGNGRFVVFASRASDLTADSTDGTTQVFRRDMQTGVTSLVSLNEPATGGANADAGSTALAISGDGRFVAFDSAASDLVALPTGGHDQVFERDMQTGETQLVSVNKLGTAGADETVGDASTGVAVSADGQRVAFGMVAADLTSDPTAGASQIYNRNMESGQTEMVSLNQAGTSGGNFGSGGHGLAMSADGNHVAFTSYAKDLTPFVTTNDQVYVRDMRTGSTKFVSSNRDGLASGMNSDNLGLSISSDGRFIAFVSGLHDLTWDPFVGLTQVFRRDLEAGTTQLVSVNMSGTGGANAHEVTYTTGISANGRYVAFQSSAPDITPDTTGGLLQVYERNLG